MLPSCSQLVYMLQAPPAGAATEMPLPARVFIALPAVDPVADVGGGVEGVEQDDRVRAAGLEGDRDVAAHRRRRHHQYLDALGLGDVAGSPSTARGQRHRAHRSNSIESSLIPTSSTDRLSHPRVVVNHITTTGAPVND